MRDFDDADSELDVAFWLTRSIGRSIGLNFSDAMNEGRLEPDEFASLITICRACPNSTRCQTWLGQAGGPKGAKRPPEFCPNAAALQSLKPH